MSGGDSLSASSDFKDASQYAFSATGDTRRHYAQSEQIQSSLEI